MPLYEALIFLRFFLIGKAICTLMVRNLGESTKSVPPSKVVHSLP